VVPEHALRRHGGPHEKPLLDGFRHETGRYRVPLIFFHPGLALPPADESQVTSTPTSPRRSWTCSASAAGSPSSSAGASQGGERYATLYNGHSYYLIDREWSLRFHPPDEWFVHDSVKDPRSPPAARVAAAGEVLRSRLQATLQYFQNGLLENSLLVPDPPPANEPAPLSAPGGSGR